VFWLLEGYASYILKYIFDIFQNVKKIDAKNSHIHFHMLYAHKVVAQQIHVSCGACTKDNFLLNI
jgi:hypothetical protein